MHPILFTVAGVPIYAHGFFFLLGLLAGLVLLIYEARRRRWPKEEVVPISTVFAEAWSRGAKYEKLEVL